MSKLFNKKQQPVQGANMFSTENLVSIANYVPNPSEKRYYVIMVSDVAIFKPFDPKNEKSAAKSLYAIGRIPHNEDNSEFINTYGDRVILVSKKFTKLSKKYQTMLVEKAAFEAAGVPERFIGAMGVDGTSMDKKLAAELLLMEKYGYFKVKRLLKKEQNINITLIKSSGKSLHKAFKAAKKHGTKVENFAEDVGIKKPVTFKNTEPAQV